MKVWLAENLSDWVKSAQISQVREKGFYLSVNTIYNRNSNYSDTSLKSIKRQFTENYGDPKKRVKWVEKEV